MQDSKWYYESFGAAKGPMTSQELILKVNKGELTLVSLVFKEGEGQWYPLEHFTEITEQLGKNDVKVDAEWVVLRSHEVDGKQSFEQVGPFNAEQILQLIENGKIKFSDHVWRDGFKAWVPLGKIDEFEKPLTSSVEVDLSLYQLPKHEIISSSPAPIKKFSPAAVVDTEPEQIPEDAKGEDLAQPSWALKRQPKVEILEEPTQQDPLIQKKKEKEAAARKAEQEAVDHEFQAKQAAAAAKETQRKEKAEKERLKQEAAEKEAQAQKEILEKEARARAAREAAKEKEAREKLAIEKAARESEAAMIAAAVKLAAEKEAADARAEKLKSTAQIKAEEADAAAAVKAREVARKSKEETVTNAPMMTEKPQRDSSKDKVVVDIPTADKLEKMSRLWNQVATGLSVALVVAGVVVFGIFAKNKFSKSRNSVATEEVYPDVPVDSQQATNQLPPPSEGLPPPVPAEPQVQSPSPSATTVAPQPTSAPSQVTTKTPGEDLMANENLKRDPEAEDVSKLGMKERSYYFNRDQKLIYYTSLKGVKFAASIEAVYKKQRNADSWNAEFKKWKSQVKAGIPQDLKRTSFKGDYMFPDTMTALKNNFKEMLRRGEEMNGSLVGGRGPSRDLNMADVIGKFRDISEKAKKLNP